MTQPQIAKAILIPMDGDKVVTDTSKHIVVQFNPASLKVSLSNSLKADNKGGAGAAAQFIDKSESSLSVELLFDTTRDMNHSVAYKADGADYGGDFKAAANSDVRKLTQRIAAAFMQPQGEPEAPKAPQKCRFQWGSFQFTGMVSGYGETLDFFAPEGIPLRATLSLTLKEDRYQFDMDVSVQAAKREAPVFAKAPPAPPPPGEPAGAKDATANEAAKKANRPEGDWRAIAQYNQAENPRFMSGDNVLIPPTGDPGGSGISALAMADYQKGAGA